MRNATLAAAIAMALPLPAAWARNADRDRGARRDHRHRPAPEREHPGRPGRGVDGLRRDDSTRSLRRRRHPLPVGARAEPECRVVLRPRLPALLYPRPRQHRLRPQRIAAGLARVRRRRAGEPDPEGLPGVRSRDGRESSRAAGHAVRPQHAGGRREVQLRAPIARGRRLRPGRATARTARSTSRAPSAARCRTQMVDARVGIYQQRDDWVDNTFTGEGDALEGFDEVAGRGAVPVRAGRSLSGARQYPRAQPRRHGAACSAPTSSCPAATASIPTTSATASLTTAATTIRRAPRAPADRSGSTSGLGDDVTLTSITGYESIESSSLGDIDGGFGAGSRRRAPGPCPRAARRVCIPFPSETADGIDDHDQLTQEFRLASKASDRMFWQAGVYYFDPSASRPTRSSRRLHNATSHENTAWAVFGHVSYDVTDAFT